MPEEPTICGGILMREVGWICPNCKRVYAPKTSECEICNADKKGKKYEQYC